MTTAHALLDEAARHGVRLSAVGDRIEYEAPQDPPAELLDGLRAHREELHAILTAPPREPTLRVVVDTLEPQPGPVRLNAWALVLHPARCIRADLASLERVVAALAEARRNGDHRTAAALEDAAEELLARLEACGARVRVVEVQP